MRLNELDDPAAVQIAMDEFDELGRDEFLRQYGYGRARTYFVMRDGVAYDSKAIAGVAYGYQHGAPLKPNEFSGGDETVAAKLNSLGFEVRRALPGDWHFEDGDISTRAEIHGAYGGATYGGIEPSKTTPNLMIYTDPKQGALNGYDYDGWDRNDSNVFYYTGAGRHGDQVMTNRNLAILNHAEDGRTLRLFEAVDEPSQPGGKRQEYIGAFYLDTDNPYRMAPAPDAAGDPRQVIVFRLIREGTIALEVQPAPPGETDVLDPPMAPEASEIPEAADRSAQVVLVPSENVEALEFETAPRAGGSAKREEAHMVAAFEDHLRTLGHTLKRVRIRVPGEAYELVTDTYDATDNVLYEAKSASDRATIRLAVGQLLDYLRFVPTAEGRILVPDEPTADLKQLVHSVGFKLVFRDSDRWVVVD